LEDYHQDNEEEDEDASSSEECQDVAIEVEA
jgi:hypothetical protein